MGDTFTFTGADLVQARGFAVKSLNSLKENDEGDIDLNDNRGTLVGVLAAYIFIRIMGDTVYEDGGEILAQRIDACANEVVLDMKERRESMSLHGPDTRGEHDV